MQGYKCACIWCKCILVYVCVWVYTYVSGCTCGCVRIYVYLSVAFCSDLDSFVRPKSVTGDPDPIRICANYEPDTLAIRKPTHEIIRRSPRVRAVKTRRRFGSKTASFHVSVCSCIIFLIYHCQYYLYVTRIISCDWDILPVWLSVSLHETSVSAHIIYLVDMSVYQYHFLWLLIQD